VEDIHYAQVRPYPIDYSLRVTPHPGQPHTFEDAQYQGDCSGWFLIHGFRYQRCACGETRILDPELAVSVAMRSEFFRYPLEAQADDDLREMLRQWRARAMLLQMASIGERWLSGEIESVEGEGNEPAIRWLRRQPRYRAVIAELRARRGLNRRN
jgi:hypothetical protein